MRIAFVYALLSISFGFVPFEQLLAQNTRTERFQGKACELSKEETQIYASNLRHETKFPRVVETSTAQGRFDNLDTLNLMLATQGRGIPPEIREDFKEKNKLSCNMQPISGLENIYFVSKNEANEMLKKNSHAIQTKYGQYADLQIFSRIGFNADRTLALVHVSGEWEGTLYLYERKNQKWSVKWSVLTWASGASLSTSRLDVWSGPD